MKLDLILSIFQFHKESHRRLKFNGRHNQTAAILLLGKPPLLPDSSLGAALADSLRLLPRAAPPHGAAALRSAPGRLLADPPHPQRSARRPGRAGGPPGHDPPLEEPLPEARLPVHQVHGGPLQQVQDRERDAARPDGPAQAVGAGGRVAPGRAGAAVSGQLAVFVQHLVAPRTEQRELQRLFPGEVEQCQEDAGNREGDDAGAGEGGRGGQRGAGVAGGGN